MWNVCDNDGVVDWCIVLVEIPLTRFEECWPLPTESLAELPWNLNILSLTLTLWPINSGVLTSLLLPHFSSSLTDSLPSLNLLCHSKTYARFMQDAPKAVWSIPYVSVAFFPSLKHNFIAYRSFNVSDCILKFTSCDNLTLVGCIPIAAVAVHLNLSSHNMYSNNIVNFEESTTILNVHTTKSRNLLKAPRNFKRFTEVSNVNNILATSIIWQIL